MIIIDSPYHVTFSSTGSSKPQYACVEMCRKVFWEEDLEGWYGTNACPACKGRLQSAVEGVHFKVLSQSKRPLKVSDFEKFTKVSKEEKEKLRQMLSGKTVVSHMSTVKEKFVEKAKKEWC